MVTCEFPLRFRWQLGNGGLTQNPSLMSVGDRCHLLGKTGGSSGPARLCVLGAGAKTEPGQVVVFFLDGLSWSLAFFRVPLTWTVRRGLGRLTVPGR